MGYDATRLLLQSIANAGSAKPDEITKAIEKSHLAGVTGQIRFSEGNRVPLKPVSIISAMKPRDAAFQITPTKVPAP